MGVTFANFHISGKQFCLRDKLKNLQSGSAIIGAVSFSNLGLTKSDPHALLAFRLASMSCTSVTVIVIVSRMFSLTTLCSGKLAVLVFNYDYEAKYWLNKLAFSLLLVITTSLSINGGYVLSRFFP